MFAVGDHFILTFTETIVCHGYLADANQGNGLTTAALELLVSFGGKKSFKSGPLPGNLDYACQGNELKVSAPAFTATTARDVAGEEISIKIFGGLYDRHGNGVVPVDGKVLASGRAGEERQQIDGKITAVDQKMSRKFEGLDTKLGTKFDGVDTKFDGVDTKFEGVDASLKDVDAKLDAKFDSVDAKFAALSNTLAQVLKSIAGMGSSADGGAKADAGFPVCTGPALCSFARHIRGRVPAAAATTAAAATAAVCASKCLEVATCAAFSFGRSDGCILATGPPSSELSGDRTSRFLVRLEKCSGL